MTDAQHAARGTKQSMLAIAALALVWGSNWPILKIGVSEIPPFTFRFYTLVFAGLGLLAVSRAAGESVRIPRALWPTVLVLATFNIFGWNALVLFGIREMPAGRSAILAYTMPVWATLISLFVVNEPLSRRKAIGLGLGMAGMLVLLWDDLSEIGKSPFGALMIVGAAVAWAIGTVLLRKLKPALPQNTLSGWMMVTGWVPIAILAVVTDAQWLTRPASLSAGAWFAIFYNVFLAGMLAHWAWFTLARKLPVAVSSLSSLPVPVVGVFAGIVVLGERPGPAEWVALTLVLSALVAVLLPPLGRRTPAAVGEPEP